jgi:hypothetical protein
MSMLTGEAGPSMRAGADAAAVTSRASPSCWVARLPPELPKAVATPGCSALAVFNACVRAAVLP